MILASFEFNIGKAIKAQQSSPCFFGSEFRDWVNLGPLLHKHPLWNQAKEILQDSATFPLEEISQDDHRADLTFMLNCRNHKLVLQGHATIKALIQEDVTHGLSLPLTLECALKIPNASVSPLGLVKQATINELSQITQKDWMMMHDFLN